MTRQFNQRFACSNCGCEMTAETSFGRWIRDNKRLDSVEHGICVYDIDYVVHKYKTMHGRSKQLMMLVEVKTRNSKMSDEQRDTMYMLSQITQNRKVNQAVLNNRDRWSTNDMHLLSKGETLVHSAYLNRNVTVVSFGVFHLQFSALGPQDSDFMAWNGKAIDANTLESLLRFDIDPVGFRPIEELFRKHHMRNDQPLLNSLEN
jgi:hypothetical protein